jgi:A118 family predicted phage portal protein
MHARRINLRLFDEFDMGAGLGMSIQEKIDYRLIWDLRNDFKFPMQDPVLRVMDMHSAYYSGDPILMGRTYQSMVNMVGGSTNESFWSKDLADGLVKLHVPIASDISQTSADMLFAEMPEISIPEADDDEGSEGDKASGKDSQDRLDEIIERCGFASRLVEAAEACSAIGGVYLVPTWDTEIANYPLLAINQADNAMPVFKWGHLVEVTFWKVIYEDAEVCYRHLEKHQKGLIANALYKGTQYNLGEQVALTEHEATKNLPEAIETGFDGLMVKYVPNMRPNRRFRGSSHGQSDYAGIEPLMDALDEVYSSWMRDVRLARARIIVPESFLDFEDVKGDGKKSPYFNVDKAVYTALSMDPLTAAKGSQMTLFQFDIRAEKHKQTAYELLERIITHAGYSPQTFGLNMDGKAETGTALNIRERKTYITRQKKWKYWKGAIEDVLEMMLYIDNVMLKNPTQVFRPSAKLTDSMSRDLSSVSTALQALANAVAVSTETKVRLLNPDWSEEAIEAEVKAIKDETSAAAPTIDTTIANPLDPENQDPEEIGIA